MDKSLILNRIKDSLKFRYNKEFADFLGINTTTLAMWYKRNTYDTELLFNKCEFLNAEWLLTGKGPMLKSEVVPATSELDQVYKQLAESRLQTIISLNKEIANLHKDLKDKDYPRLETFLYTNVAEPAPMWLNQHLN